MTTVLFKVKKVHSVNLTVHHWDTAKQVFEEIKSTQVTQSSSYYEKICYLNHLDENFCDIHIHLVIEPLD